MDVSQLTRIVQNVGDSQKRGQSFLNGQFGFGVHAFRAAANRLTVRTSTSSGQHLSLSLLRSQSDDIEPPQLIESSLETDVGTGTEFQLSSFENTWLDGLDTDKIALEIEQHFDRILSRSGLKVTVHDAALQRQRVCQPFDYESVDGFELSRTLQLKNSEPISVLIKLASHSVAGRQVCIFANGRRICEMAQLRSYLRQSPFRGYIWNNPQLIGYIEVGRALQPVITRDELVRTAARDTAYKLFAKEIEPELKKLVDQVNRAKFDQNMNKLQNVLGKCFQNTLRAQRVKPKVEELDALDSKFQAKPAVESSTSSSESESSSESDKKEPETKPKKEETPPTNVIHFVNSITDPQGSALRAIVVGDSIHINMSHPDFVSRTSFSREGKPVFTERLCSYLSYVVGAMHMNHLVKRFSDEQGVKSAIDGMLDTTAGLELRLRKQIKDLTEPSPDQIN
eukprot:c9137_g1_i3.p1 GENE.c9137_g1_i3~~c9137_g1_i3.p1  ORF type:complete len:523 (+),score=145.29 c9137_g1_i3:211-1569(+)